MNPGSRALDFDTLLKKRAISRPAVMWNLMTTKNEKEHLYASPLRVGWTKV